MIGNPTEGLKPLRKEITEFASTGRMIGNPTEGLKPGCVNASAEL